MKAWLLVGWAAVLLVSGGCGPSEISLIPDGPDDDLSDAPIFVRFDARIRPDASPSDARPGADGAILDVPDADSGGTLTFDPPEAFVVPGGTATIKVVLAQTATKDTDVALATTGTDAAVPTSVVIAAGQTSADITVTGHSVGLVSVTAGVERALIHVVPPISSLAPAGPTPLGLGTDQTLTITLAAGADVAVPVTIAIDDTNVLSAEGSVTIPARQTTITFSVHGAGLGVSALHALIGDNGADAKVRVNGLFMSEILYDAVGNDGGLEWIELRNDTDATIDMSRINLAVALAQSFVIIVPFSDSMAPGECAVYIMPPDMNDATAGILGNGTDGDGIRLVVGSDQVIDEVIYGDNNDDAIPDENEIVPADTDVVDVPSGKTIARDLDSPGRPWRAPASPSQHDCTNP